MKKIWHPYWKWECLKSGFYDSFDQKNITKEFAQEQYRIFLSDLEMFEEVLKLIIKEWKYSCEHFLSDKNRNKIAWLGQASLAYIAGIPSDARGGYKLLTKEQQKLADRVAEKYYLLWKEKYKHI